MRPPYIVASQLKIFDPGGDGDEHRGERKERVEPGPHTDHEHVVAQVDRATPPMDTVAATRVA